MMCRFSQLRRKEVINICDGSRLGCVGDLELCIPEGTVKALIVFGPCRFFGLFGRGEDYYIPWDCVQRFGEDIILIDKPFQRREGEKKKRRWKTHGRAYRCGHVFTLQKKMPPARQTLRRRHSCRFYFSCCSASSPPISSCRCWFSK